MQAVLYTEKEKEVTVYRILFAISFVHMLNDSVQAVIPAIYPILQKSMGLSFFQLGMIGFAINMTASVMQPVVGLYTDRKPSPYLPSLGMGCTLLGMLGLAFAPNYWFVLLSVIFVGLGSAAFHPEGSRIANLAAGSRRGLAQSIYQVGGNTGHSMAPLITALIFVPFGQFGAIWFTAVAAMAILVLLYIASWYTQQLSRPTTQLVRKSSAHPEHKGNRVLGYALLILVILVFVRSWYSSGISGFYVFYLMDEYGLTIEQAQPYIFSFLAAGVLGTFFGGPLADRFGKRNMILFSILGSVPLAILLPFAGPYWSYPTFILLGFILHSSYSVTVVYAQDLYPGKIGTMSGLIVGLAFGMGGIGSVTLGHLSDVFGIEQVMIALGYLLLLGLLTVLLPSDQKLKQLT